MNTQLSLDTCNSLCAAALSSLDNGVFRLIASNTRDLGRGHAEVLVDQIRQLLADAGLKTADISRVAVTIGPGSFTGQRVGLAVARTFAASMNVEAVGVGVLDALIFEAHSLDPSLAAYCAISDAKRDGAYIKTVTSDSRVLLKACLVAASEIPRHLETLDQPFAIAGTGASLLNEEMFVARCKNLNLSFPSIQTIAQMGHELNATENPAEPLYLRDADAKPQNAKHILRMQTSPNVEVAL